MVHDGAVGNATMAGHDSGERIAIPIAADRTPWTTTRCAVQIAAQGGLGIEFVAAAGGAGHTRFEGQLRARCSDAAAAGARRTSWCVLDGGPADVTSYITWSGASLLCVGTDAHHRASATADGSCAVPLLVIGPAWRPCADGYRQFVVGLDGSSGQSALVAAAAAVLAARLAAELILIEVITPGGSMIDVPASAHLHWVAHGLDRPPRLFDTVAARRPAPGLVQFLDPGSVVVVGARRHPRRSLGGVAGRLVQQAPCPVLIVPTAVTSPGRCCTGAGRRSRIPA